MVISVLNAPRINVMPNFKGKGNGIKRESNGWAIHTQTDKSLYDTSPSKAATAGTKDFVFNTYQKRKH